MAAKRRWRGLDDLFGQVPLDDRAKQRLFDEMSRRERRYHGVGHLEQLWRRHRLYRRRVGLVDPEIERLIACAIAYHDSVYDLGRADNEERSAENWLAASAGSALSEADRQWVAETIRATKDHLAHAPDHAARGRKAQLSARARAWVIDLDLTPLGDPPGVFERNGRLLRAEQARLSEAQWRAGQRAFRRRLLAAPRIYRVPELAAIFEAAARRNLARPPFGGG